MKNKLLILATCVSLLFSFFACREGEEYYAFQQIKNGLWEKKNTLSFQIDSLRTHPLKKYAVSIELTHNNLYPYQNLWLIVSSNFRDTLQRNDTVEIRLTDKKGNWLGKGAGGLRQLSTPYKETVQLDSQKTYTVSFRHFMKDETLNGIEKVGVKIMEQ